METGILMGGYELIGIMENKMETTIMGYMGYLGDTMVPNNRFL